MFRFFNLMIGFMFVAQACSQSGEPEQQQEAAYETQRQNTAATVDDTAGSDAAKPAETAFQAKYPNAENISWGVDANDYQEAEFTLDEKKYRADFSEQGQWIETERSIKYNELPKAVQSVIEKDYDKNDISEIEEVDNAEKGKFFDVEFKQKGKNQDIEFRENGEIIQN